MNLIAMILNAPRLLHELRKTKVELERVRQLYGASNFYSMSLEAAIKVKCDSIAEKLLDPRIELLEEKLKESEKERIRLCQLIADWRSLASISQHKISSRILAERKRCAMLALEACLDIGCTVNEAEGCVRNTRIAISKAIMEEPE